MIDVLLVIIIAILIFGGGAILSAVAGVFGFLVAAVAFIAICFWIGVDPTVAFVTLCVTALADMAGYKIYQAIQLSRFETYLQSKNIKNASELVDLIRRRKTMSDKDLEAAQMKFSALNVHKHIPEKSPKDWLYGESYDRNMKVRLEASKQK